MSIVKLYRNDQTNEMDISMVLDPNKLQNDIVQCDVEQQQRESGAVAENGVGKGVLMRLFSRSCQDLQWVAGKRSSSTYRSLRSKYERPAIASPFMPITAQIPIEFERRITIPHVASAPREYRGRYGSVQVKIQKEKLQKKPSGSSSESASSSDEESDDKKKNNRRGSSSSCSSSSDRSSSESVFAKLASLTAKEWMTICMLSAANLGSTTAFSCIAPFYPNEAKSKGLNSFETGLVFGVFELVMFFVAPLLGKYMVFLGSRTMFVTGIAVTGITAILFGFLNYIQSSSFFFWSSVGVRVAEAIGDAAFVTSSFAIGAKCFPGRISTIIGIMETFAGLGYTVGPPIGGILYELGGFQLPFSVLGIVLIFVAVLAYFLIERMEDDPTLNGKGMLGMLRIPMLWIMIYAVAVCAVSLSFLDPTLSNHLDSFQLTPVVVGLMFLLCGGIYAISAPFWGIFIDKFNCNKTLMFFGALGIAISMLVIGPLPLLNAKKNLTWIAIALGLLGLAAGALYIPTFQTSIAAVRDYDYEESLQTYGCVSGIFQSAFSFGSFFGPTIGGLCVQWIGFPWTTTVIALFNIILIIILLYFFAMCNKSGCRNGPNSGCNNNN